MTNFLTPSNIAERLGLSKPDAVLGWIARGELRAVNVASKRSGRPRWRIDQGALDEFLAARTNSPKIPTARRRKVKQQITEYF